MRLKEMKYVQCLFIGFDPNFVGLQKGFKYVIASVKVRKSFDDRKHMNAPQATMTYGRAISFHGTFYRS